MSILALPQQLLNPLPRVIRALFLPQTILATVLTPVVLEVVVVVVVVVVEVEAIVVVGLVAGTG